MVKISPIASAASGTAAEKRIEDGRVQQALRDHARAP